MRTIRLAALALVFTLLPACSTLPLGPDGAQTQAQPAASLEMQAYALVEIYSTALNTAAGLVAHPDTPPAIVAALARAEAAATPAANAVLGALAASLRAAQSPESTIDSTKAHRALTQALKDARGPIRQLAEATRP